jgi:hypothetical protein
MAELARRTYDVQEVEIIQKNVSHIWEQPDRPPVIYSYLFLCAGLHIVIESNFVRFIG